MDKTTTSQQLLGYLVANNYKTLDLNQALGNVTKPTTLIYDQHWSKEGRKLISDLILDYIKKNKLI